MAGRMPQPSVAISSAQHAVRVPRKQIRELVAFVAEAEGAAVAEVDLAVVSGQEIAAMNQRYLRHAGATDVLSFDLSDDTRIGLAAQIVVCGDLAAKEGPAHGLTVRQELLLYVVHGLLHLMGYDDQSVRGAARMHARQDELLAKFLRRRSSVAARRPARRRGRPRP